MVSYNSIRKSVYTAAATAALLAGSNAYAQQARPDTTARPAAGAQPVGVTRSQTPAISPLYRTQLGTPIPGLLTPSSPLNVGPVINYQAPAPKDTTTQKTTPAKDTTVKPAVTQQGSAPKAKPWADIKIGATDSVYFNKREDPACFIANAIVGDTASYAVKDKACRIILADNPKAFYKDDTWTKRNGTSVREADVDKLNDHARADTLNLTNVLHYARTGQVKTTASAATPAATTPAAPTGAATLQASRAARDSALIQLVRDSSALANSAAQVKVSTDRVAAIKASYDSAVASTEALRRAHAVQDSTYNAHKLSAQNLVAKVTIDSTKAYTDSVALKARTDTIAKIRADSIALADSTRKADNARAYADSVRVRDSTRKADSLANLVNTPTNTSPAPGDTTKTIAGLNITPNPAPVPATASDTLPVVETPTQPVDTPRTGADTNKVSTIQTNDEEGGHGWLFYGGIVATAAAVGTGVHLNGKRRQKQGKSYWGIK
jgi:hypothetical protein